MAKNDDSSMRSPNDVEAWRLNVHRNMADSAGSRSSFASQPPAYSPTVEPSIPSHKPEHCCAFQALEWRMRDVSEYEGLLRKSQQLRFLCWVAYCRTTDQSILAEERRKCPMKWCRTSCPKGDDAALMNHVSECSRLSDGEYFCPYCQRHESYIPKSPTVAKPTHAKHMRKQFLKNAFNAVRQLGSKTRGIRKASHQPSHHAVRDDLWLPRQDGVEQPSITELFMDEKEVVNTALELDGRERAAPAPVPPVRVHQVGQSRVELDGAERTFGIEHIEHSYEMEGVVPTELDADADADALSCPSMDWDTSDILTPDSLSPVSPVSASQQWCRATSRDFDSPISPTESSSYDLWTSDLNELSISRVPPTGKDKSEPKAQRTEPLNSAQDVDLNVMRLNRMKPIPSIRVDTTVNSSKPIASIPPTTYELDSNIISPESGALGFYQLKAASSTDLVDSADPPRQRQVFLVEELRSLFNFIFKESIRKVRELPMSSAAITFLAANPSAALVFEHGLCALHKVVRGVLPSTLWEVFGLSHLAYAAAIAGHPQDLVERFQQTFDEIFENIIEWSKAIAREDDRASFIELAHTIWAPDTHSFLLRPSQGVARTEPCNSDLYSRSRVGQGSPVSTGSSPTSVFQSLRGAGGYQSGLQREFLDRQLLQSSLKNGIAVRHCLQYLDTLEYTGIDFNGLLASSNQAGESLSPTRKAARTSGIMKTSITEPLIQTQGLEAFWPSVRAAEKLLDNGFRLELRALELKLILEAKRCAKSRTLYSRFIDEVTRLCDHSSMVVGWTHCSREEFYKRDIEHLLRIHYELRAKGRAINRQASYFQHIPSIVQSEPPTPVPPRPFSFAETPSSTESPSRTQAPFLPTATPAFDHLDLGITTPPHRHPPATSRLSTHTPVAETRPPVAESEGSRTCHQCGKVLKGKVAWLPSNMQRHIREKHSNQAQQRLTCSVAGCGKTFGRKHNRAHHMRTVHAKA